MSAAHGIGLVEATRVWARIALLSFGGPAGQIALMHRILVEEKRWIGDQRFLHALNFCMLLPGPEAQQLATYIGWLLHRTKGGLVAGGLFILPGLIAIMALSLIYAGFGNVPAIALGAGIVGYLAGRAGHPAFSGGGGHGPAGGRSLADADSALGEGIPA